MVAAVSIDTDSRVFGRCMHIALVLGFTVVVGGAADYSISAVVYIGRAFYLSVYDGPDGLRELCSDGQVAIGNFDFTYFCIMPP